ncbi:MAG TPA: hypothetical protein VF524_05230 [Polyangia bacterium]
MSRHLPNLALSWLVLLGGCFDFDAAHRRYCQDNPQCASDAGTTSDASPDIHIAPDTERDAQSDQPVDITPPQNCSLSIPCPGQNQTCHPFGYVCLQMCNSSADCPPWLDTCTEIRDPHGFVYTPKVCSCNTAQICDSYSSGFACNLLDNLCEKECASTSDCSGFQPPRLCDQLIGLCVASIQMCYVNANCPSPTQPRCDPVSGRCVSCSSSDDCAGRGDGFVRCKDDGTCVAP